MSPKPRLRIIRTWRMFNDNRIGIHLLNPSESDLERARMDARAKGFDRIFIHLSQSEMQNCRYNTQGKKVRS